MFSLSVIYVSKLFGLFPISGLNSKDPKNIKFQWKSFPTLFSICFIFTSISVSFLVLYLQSQSGPLSPPNLVGFIFFFNCAMTCVLLFRFSSRFANVMERWIQLEKSFIDSKLVGGFSANRWPLKKRIHVCAISGMLLALVEHLMSLASLAKRIINEVNACNSTLTAEFLVTRHLSHVFSIFKYNHFTGFLAEYLNFSFTFYWSFLDIFIMIISIGISFRYEKINNRIEFFRERAIPDKIWAGVRSNYNEVSELLQYVDNALDKLIILACCNDAYFILVQLLNLSS